MLPLAVLVVAGPLALRRSVPHRDVLPSAAAVTAVLALAGAGLGMAHLSQAPLADKGPSVVWYQDLPFLISVAEQTKRHWPPQQPGVAGEALEYHVLAYAHWAGAESVSDVTLTVIGLQLDVTFLLGLLVLQLGILGAAVTGRRAAGAVTAALALFAGDLALGADRPYPLLGQFFTGLHLSPSFLFGLLLFIPVLLLLRDRLVPGAPRGRGDWALIALLCLGCGGAKPTILPVLGAGLGLWVGWRVLRRHPVPRPSLFAGAVVLAAFLATYAVFYAGASDSLAIAPLSGPSDFLAGSRLEGAGLVLSGLLGTCALLVPLAGLLWLRPGRADLDSPERGPLLWMLVAAVAVFVLTDHPGGSQVYALWYGVVAALPLAAAGLLDALGAIRERRPRAPAMAAGAIVAVVAAGALDAPSRSAPEWAKRLIDPGRTVHSVDTRQGPWGVTPELAAALRKVQAKTPTDTVMAVNNTVVAPRSGDRRFFYYSALSGRPNYAGADGYSDRAYELGMDRARVPGLRLYPRRARIREAALAGDRAALRAVRADGVRVLFYDLLHGAPPPRGLPAKPLVRNRAAAAFTLD